MRTIAVLLVSSLLLLSSAVVVQAAPKILYDLTPIAFDQQPVVEQGRILVPVRSICAAAGAEVRWDGTTQTVTVTKEQTSLCFAVGAGTVYRNGDRVSLEVAPKIVKGRTFVPLRFVAEALGAAVDWDGATQTATVASAGPKLVKVKLKEQDAGRTVELQAGEVFELILDANPTTGYQWEMVSDGSGVIRQIGDAEFKPDSDLLGSGGKTTYRFEAAVPGQTWLSLDYHRTWEKDVPALKTFQVLIVVD